LLDVTQAGSVGANIRQLRMAKGMTLDNLASMSELTRGYISLVERGLKMPSIAALLRIAEALEVKAAYFFDPDSEPAPRYTLFRQEDRNTPVREGSFELFALAAGRTRKMMEPFLLSPPLKSAARRCCSSCGGGSLSCSTAKSWCCRRATACISPARRRTRCAASASRRRKCWSWWHSQAAVEMRRAHARQVRPPSTTSSMPVM
jgi:transcriptional regulator with XRE-family HTH domain